MAILPKMAGGIDLWHVQNVWETVLNPYERIEISFHCHQTTTRRTPWLQGILEKQIHPFHIVQHI